VMLLNRWMLMGAVVGLSEVAVLVGMTMVVVGMLVFCERGLQGKAGD